MSGQTTYRVVRPKFPRLLAWRLRRAGEREVTAIFWAVSLDDPQKKPTRHKFVVRVIERGFEPPGRFEVVDQDEHFFRIWLHNPVEFIVHY
jgi:hypothetical protein